MKNQQSDEWTQQVEQLARLMAARRLRVAEIRLSNRFVRLRRDPGAVAIPEPLPPLFYSAFQTPPPPEPSEPTSVWELPKILEVPSPLVGYCKPLLLEPGTEVERGQSLAQILVLGLPNDVTAPVTGILLEWKVEEGQPVEYGQTIALIEPLSEEES